MQRIPRAAIAAALLTSVSGAQVTFTHLSTVDISSTSNIANPEYIASNPSAIAWDGSRLFVAGFNNSGLVNDVAIVEVLNPYLSGPGSYGPRFGVQAATPNGRGYSGLEIERLNATLLAAYDRGAADPQGLTAWDSSGNNLWSFNMRGGSGVARDPGFGGVDFGAAWTTFGSGRRALNDETTGAVIYSTSNGMIINGAGTGTFWRDMDFNPATGDIWLREGNQVIKATRTGGNSVATAVQVGLEVDADAVAGQNIAYLSSSYGDLVIYNDRNNSSTGQDFFAVVKVIDPSGAPQTVNWGSFLPVNHPNGTAWYSFAWEAASNTLAMVDFSNRAVYLFQREAPPPTNYCTPGVSTNACNATLSFLGAPSASMVTPFDLAVSNVEGNRQGIFFYGLQPASVPWGPGSTSFLCVKTPTQRTATQNSGGIDGQCNGNYSLDWNAWMSANPAALGAPYNAGQVFYIQSWYRDPPATKTTNLSDAIAFYMGQ